MNTSALRFFVAALAHETNTFSPIPSTLRSFSEGLLHRPGQTATEVRANEFCGYGDTLRIAHERGIEVVAGTCAWAQPSGPLSRSAYESLRDEILAQLRAAGKVDAVLLTLHGAMVADGYADCEGDLLARVREMVGPDTPIGAILDLHGNVSQAMVDSGAVLIACKEYPHTDYLERTREMHAILSSAVRSRCMPRTVMQRVPMVALWGTTIGPMYDFVREIESHEGCDGILSVSAMHGFAWSDTSFTGASILVVHEGESSAVASRAVALAKSLASRFLNLRTQGIATRPPVAAALDEALSKVSGGGLVVVADGSDNAGGGAASDSTYLLRGLLERQVGNAALGMIWDPQAVILARDAGVGARLQMRIGGKVGPMSGDPIDAEVEVLSIREDACQPSLGGPEPLGLSVAVRIEGVDVVLNSIRQQVFAPECFTGLGIDLAKKSLVVVKSTQHFRALFDPISSATVYCGAPGTLNFDLSSLPYKALSRPLWPLDQPTTMPEARGATQ